MNRVSAGAVNAPTNSRNLPANPAVSGMPIRLSRKTVMHPAVTGCDSPSPARSSIPSTGRSGVLR